MENYAVNKDCSWLRHSSDKSFIVVLKAIEEHAKKELEAHDPSTQSQTIDGYLQGRLSMIREVVREYANG